MGQNNSQNSNCLSAKSTIVKESRNEPFLRFPSKPSNAPSTPHVIEAKKSKNEESKLQEATRNLAVEDNSGIDKKVSIYILELENGKYYIGQTSNLQARLKHHFSGNGSEWTKRHKPLKVVETFTDCDIYDEDKYTLRYMQKYGIDNVRGGSHCRTDLTKEELKSLQLQIRNANGCCLRCGKKGHFASSCTEKISEEKEKPYKCVFCSNGFESDKGRKFHEQRWCRSNENSVRYKNEHKQT